MKKWIIALIVVGSVATVGGAVVLGLGIAHDMTTSKIVVHEHEVTESFTNFNFDLSVSDLTVKASEDGKNKLVFEETEKYYHEFSVKEDTLYVKSLENYKWYDFIHMGLGKVKVTLYTASTEFNNGVFVSSTGDINIDKEFIFDNLKVTQSTGDSHIACKVAHNLEMETTTGDQHFDGVSVENMTLKASTGKVDVKNSEISNALTINTSTGNVVLDNVKANTLSSTCSTGKASLTNVIISDNMSLKASTGDVRIVDSDALSVNIETSTGDVNALFLTNKIVFAESKTGDINVPHLADGGVCNIKTSTGDITVSIKG